LVLLYAAQHPGCTVEEIAGALVVTRRTVWSIVGDLKRAGLLRAEPTGKRHHYFADLSAELPDPALSHLTLDDVQRLLGGAAPAAGPVSST
jgi:hypothetical protein